MTRYTIINIIMLIPVKPTSSYSKFYKQVCKQLKLKMNETIRMGISDSELKLQIEQINFHDLDALSLLIHSCKFKAIHLFGENQCHQQEKKEKKVRMNKSMIQKAKRNFSQSEQFRDFLSVLADVVAKSLELHSIHISELNLTIEMIQILSKGIAQAKSLKELQIRYCFLTNQHLQTVKNALISNSSLIGMDLSNNMLGDQTGVILQRVLEEHAARRDKIEWAYKSKGEMAEEEVLISGLCEIDLSYNKLTDLFVKDVSYFLENDRWLKSLNLRGNHIEAQGIQQLSEVLNRNSCLISVDIRENPGSSEALSKEIYRKLVRNMNKLKSDNTKEKDENLLANVSAIPKQNNTSSYSAIKNTTNSFQNDQESPLMSFGDRILELNPLVKQLSQSSKKDTIKFKQIPVDSNQCQDCLHYQQKLFTCEQFIKNLKLENQILKSKLQKNGQQLSQSYANQSNGVQQAHTSTSNVLNNIWQNDPQNQHPNPDQEDIIHRIEFMMCELTRMMDSLENQNTNNLTAHLSSTYIGQNNNTHVIFEREAIERGNQEQLINILGNNSQNNSQIANQQENE